jgi:hypothetical protein
VKAALGLAASSTAAGVISASAALLTEGVLNTMFLTKLKTIGAGVMLLGLAATGAGVLGYQNAPGDSKPTEKQEAPAPKKGQRTATGAFLDQATGVTAPTTPEGKGRTFFGGGGVVSPTSESVPQADSAARAADLVDAAQRAYEATMRLYLNGETQAESVVPWSQRLLDAQLSASTQPADRIAAYQAHLDRMRKLEDQVKESHKREMATSLDLAAAQFHRLQAEQWLAREKAGLPPTGQGDQPGGKDPDSQATLRKLDKSIAMRFPNETPLQDILKYIKAATSSKNDQGIPIYVDPVGLQTVSKRMTSPVTIDLEGVPLRTTLGLLLHQIDLRYTVVDGVLIITHQNRISSIGVWLNRQRGMMR